MEGWRWRLVAVAVTAASLVLTSAAAGLPGTAVSGSGLPASSASSEPPSWLGDIPGLARVAPDVAPPGAPVSLDGCTQTLDLFRDDPARVRPFVPAHYELGTNAYFGPNVATIFVTALVCDQASVDGGPASPMVLSMLGVQVRAGRSDGDHPADAIWDVYNQSTLNLLPSSSWYLIATQTNNPAVARRLNGAGLDVETVEDLVYRTDYGTAEKSDFLDVPSLSSPYQLQTTTLLPDCCFYHNHDWAFWHDGPRGTVGFLQHLHGMLDYSCGLQADRVVQAVLASCGAKLEAQPGTAVAGFLGASVREASQALNHPESHAAGYITLLEAGPYASSPRATP